jgi:hypothetical protein
MLNSMQALAHQSSPTTAKPLDRQNISKDSNVREAMLLLEMLNNLSADMQALPVVRKGTQCHIVA